MEKHQGIRYNKTFENWLRVSRSQLNVSESDLKNWPKRYKVKAIHFKVTNLDFVM